MAVDNCAVINKQDGAEDDDHEYRLLTSDARGYIKPAEPAGTVGGLPASPGGLASIMVTYDTSQR